MDRVLFNFGPITIYWYSITMLLAVLTGIYFSIIESKKQGMYSFISDLITYVIIFGIVGARLYYVIFNFEQYKNDLFSIFRIWEGGIAIYGAIIAGLISIIYFAKKRKESIIKTTDIIVPGLLLAQAIGRWGNFFNSEAHGNMVSLEFLQSLHLPNFIIDGMHINGIYYHPTFLYESVWCVIGFLLLLGIRKFTNRKDGVMTCCYFIWYGIGRFIIEGLRTDSLYFGIFRISQIVSIILIIIGIIGIMRIIYDYKKNKRKLIFMKGDKNERIL